MKAQIKTLHECGIHSPIKTWESCVRARAHTQRDTYVGTHVWKSRHYICMGYAVPEKHGE